MGTVVWFGLTEPVEYRTARHGAPVRTGYVGRGATPSVETFGQRLELVRKKVPVRAALTDGGAEILDRVVHVPFLSSASIVYCIADSCRNRSTTIDGLIDT